MYSKYIIYHYDDLIQRKYIDLMLILENDQKAEGVEGTFCRFILFDLYGVPINWFPWQLGSVIIFLRFWRNLPFPTRQDLRHT